MGELKWNMDFALEQAAGDKELLDELIDIFRDSSASDFAKIIKAVREDDFKAAGAAAHSIKGAAASLGIEGIRELVSEIETDCRAGSTGKVNDKLPLLKTLIDELNSI